VALTPKQKRFVAEYLVDLNATQAAIRAGYSEKTAYSMGQRLLKNVEVQSAVQKAMQKRENRIEITQDRVMLELARIALSRGTDYVSVKRGRVVLTDTDELNDDQRAAITGIKQGRDGIEIKTADKVRALELLGRHLGLFDGRGNATQTDNNLADALREAAGGLNLDELDEAEFEADSSDGLVDAK